MLFPSLSPHSAKIPAETPLTPAPSPASDFQCPDLRGFHILILDDEADARFLLERILTKCNATVTTAASAAAEAIQAVQKHRPDMILSDIGMPGEDGYEFLAKLRRLPDSQGGSTPAVALTAFAAPRRPPPRPNGRASQMHLPKPVEPAELLAVASNLFTSASRRSKSHS